MRMSQGFIPTVKEAPSEAEIASHILMIRAGMMRKLAAGIYTYLPLGWRVIRKVEQIVREEMDKAGAIELLMPAMQPAELWQETGRWDIYGDLMVRVKDRHNRDFGLGPTHEEVITDLVRNEISSYRQLPLNLYQIQTKFRDEFRPRFGIMRGREFIMKDAYSFDVDEEGANTSYEKMRAAYNAIFSRCGLKFRQVEADSGAIGGAYSHEFMVLADSGEDEIVVCDKSDYAANTEKAETLPPTAAELAGEGFAPAELEKVETPDTRTIEEVTAFLKCKPEQMIKTLIFMADEKPVVVLLRGDHEANEVKIKNYLKATELELADEETILKVTGAPLGFAGPVGMDGVRIIADHALQVPGNYITGANEKDAHVRNVVPNRDYKPEAFTDLRLARQGDPSPKADGGKFEIYRGIEVGHIFKLGTKYSQAMSAMYLDENGERNPAIMGCYGIGVTRTVASAIEQNNDKDGIIWPMPIAPYQVTILALNNDNEEVITAAGKIYEELQAAGIEVLLDDRQERAGVKFKDADLIGVPLRINVGARGLKNNELELRHRKDGVMEKVAPDVITERISEIIKAEMGA